MIDDNHPSETSESSEEGSITDLQDDTFYNVNESLLVEMDQAELTAINNKIKNRKAFLTKYERQLTDLQDFIQRDPDSGTNLYLAADVKKAGLEYRRRYNELVELFQAKIEGDPDGSETTAADWDQQTTRFQKTLFQILAPLEKAVLQPPAAAAPPAGAPQPPARPQEVNKFLLSDLKPFQLELTHTAVTYDDWAQRFGTYFRAAGLDNRPNDEQRGFLRNSISSDLWTLVESHIGAFPVYSDDEEDTEIIDSVMKVIAREFLKLQPLVMRRLGVFTKQQVNQSASAYIAETRRDGRSAALHLLNENKLLCFLVLKGLTNKELVRKILEVPAEELTISRIEEVTRIFENSTSSANTLVNANQANQATPNEIFKLTSYSKQKRDNKFANVRSNASGSSPSSSTSNSRPQLTKNDCWSCGSADHPRSKCPQRNKTCNKCHIKGHISRVCLKNSSNNATKNVVRAITDDYPNNDNSEDSDDDYCPNVVSCITSKPSYSQVVQGQVMHATPTPTIPVLINGLEHDILPDSGSTRCIASMFLIQQLGLDFQPTSENLFNASGHHMVVLGQIDLEVSYRDHRVKANFLVSNAIDKSILSWSVSEALHILNIVRSVDSVLPPNHDSAPTNGHQSHSAPTSAHNLSVNRNAVDGQSSESDPKSPVHHDLLVQKSRESDRKLQSHPIVSKSTNLISSSDSDHLSRKYTPEDFERVRQRFLSEYSDVFNNKLSHSITSEVVKLELKPNAELNFHASTAPMPPASIKDAIEAELQSLLDQGIIEVVTRHTKTCSRVVWVPKPNGKVRLTVDFKLLNLNLLRQIYPFLSVEDLMKLIPPDACYFACADILHAFYGLELHVDSRPLTTFITHKGRFQFTRLPMGISISPEVWSQRSDLIYEKIPHMLKLVDDLLLFGASMPSLITTIRHVLDRSRASKVTLSPDKFTIGTNAQFGGYLIDKSGIHMGIDKTLALKSFPPLKNVSDVRAWMGLVNCFKGHVPDLANLTEPIRALLKKNTAFQWGPSQQAALQAITHIITSPPVTTFFDPSKQLVIYSDASRIGLSYVAFLEDKDGNRKLLACGSRSTSSIEARYSVSELEALALHFTFQKLKFFAFRNHAIVYTDHQALLQLHQKELHQIPNARLFRIFEKLQPFSFSLRFIRGKLNYISDFLSRHVLWSHNDKEFKADQAFNGQSICFALSSINDHAISLETIRDKAKTDPDYQSTLQAYQHGLLPQDLPVQHPARIYQAIWHDLSIDNDLLVYNGRIVIPNDQPLKKSILEALHMNHCGESKMLASFRRLYYWSNASNEVKQHVSSCQACQVYLPSQNPDNLEHSPQPSYPLEHVGLDLFECLGKHYALIIDKYSGFIWVGKLSSQTSACIIKVIDEVRSQYGEIRVLRSDGAPNLVSSEMESYLTSIGTTHEVSSAYNSASNGGTEAHVKRAKTLLAKLNGNWNRFRFAIRAENCNPWTDLGVSPAELFFNRRLRMLNLPTLEANLKPADYSVYIRTKQALTQMAFKRSNAKKLSPNLSILAPGQRVRIQHPKTKRWTLLGHVNDVRPNSRSYHVELDNGTVYLRNRRFLRPIDSRE